MASACMGDIAILEVALRNHMDRQLSLISLEQSGTEDWYMAGLRFDDRTQRQIREAWGHLTIQQKKRHAHGHLVAALTFGFWRNLLENGGAIHAHWPDEGSADYENDLWRKGVVKAFLGGRRHALDANDKWTETTRWTSSRPCMPYATRSHTTSRSLTASHSPARTGASHWWTRCKPVSIWR